MKRYSAVAIALHWLTAAAILAQLTLAWRMQGPRTPESFALIQLHKSVGVTILVLTLFRLAWRLAHRPPPEPPTLAPWERGLARLTHGSFYVLLLALPLSGWLLVSASPLAISTQLYGVVPFPDLPGVASLPPELKEAWRSGAHAVHEALALTLLALLGLHVAGALKHQLFAADEPVIAQMVPGARPGRRLEPRAALIVAGAVAAVGLAWTVTPPQAGDLASPPAQPVLAGPEWSPVAAPSPPPRPASTPGPARWTVQNRARLDFETAWSGQAIRGRFDRWTADVVFDPDHLEASQVTVTVDLASAATGDAQRDASLVSRVWLDAAAHPRAVFTARRFERAGPETYVAEGLLDLRGVRKPMTLRFRLRIEGDTAHATGSGQLDRTAFGVGQEEWAATDEIPATVAIDFALTARRRTAP
ncbi:cytochrome b/b6 domain-containing protein [Phenylobacterium sp. J367]|uniref:cytochrome b/b6 domain-containing protein n=1 Tax=Phenylobacterium sp. J367 TaxID=2898435 RepID=UPI0021513618|nr:cytochrome b/b6 domain-containing protein [Phenylobacterium sp. J367]MCR5880270.1 cytochrome b/b6 domain-containing protein [Phenylobacterium sp. J367]